MAILKIRKGQPRVVVRSARPAARNSSASPPLECFNDSIEYASLSHDAMPVAVVIRAHWLLWIGFSTVTLRCSSPAGCPNGSALPVAYKLQRSDIATDW